MWSTRPLCADSLRLSSAEGVLGISTSLDLRSCAEVSYTMPVLTHFLALSRPYFNFLFPYTVSWAKVGPGRDLLLALWEGRMTSSPKKLGTCSTWHLWYFSSWYLNWRVGVIAHACSTLFLLAHLGGGWGLFEPYCICYENRFCWWLVEIFRFLTALFCYIGGAWTWYLTPESTELLPVWWKEPVYCRGIAKSYSEPPCLEWFE